MCKIVIKEFKDFSTAIEIGGEVFHIGNGFNDLKNMLREHGEKKFQIAETIYNIEKINEANFEIISGKVVINQLLTKTLIEILAESKETTRKLIAKAKENENWEKDHHIRIAFRKVILNDFIGLLKVLVTKIFAIGQEPMDRSNAKKYIRHCELFANRIVRFISFIQIAEFWEFKEKNRVVLQEDEREYLVKFFEHPFEMSPLENFKLVCKLYRIFERVNCKFRFSEMNALIGNINLNTTLHKCFEDLQEILNNMHQEEYSALQCADCEKHICCIIEAFKFLANFKLLSMQGCAYEAVYKGNSYFVHRFYHFDLDRAKESDEDEYKCSQDVHPSEGIIVYDKDYRTGLNLFPFIIDLNTIFTDSRFKICMFNQTNIDLNSLIFSNLQDLSVEEIVQGSNMLRNSDLNEILNDKEKRKQYKLEIVCTQFNLAKRIILS